LTKQEEKMAINTPFNTLAFRTGLLLTLAWVNPVFADNHENAAFAKDDRPESDYEQHAIRKAAEVLAFTGIGEGMTVIDMEAGGGLYTEIFSKTVGSDGSVHMQNPPLFDGFAGDAIKARVADGRLPNVEQMRTAFDSLPVADGSVDVVTWFLGPHELWFYPEGAPEGILGDPDKAFAEIARVLKSGGHFIALDHQAAPGSPPETGGTAHRIDEAIVVQRAAAAGLELVQESDLLANPNDDYAKNVFDPSVRRKTDRFLLKFEKQ
jgi:predicted methyltransferase